MENKPRTRDEIDNLKQQVASRFLDTNGTEVTVNKNSHDYGLAVNVTSGLTLAPNYNEKLQMDDYLEAIELLGEI